MAKVVRFHELGGPEVLRLEEHDVGAPGAGEVLLDVEAIGLNRSEANFRRDRYLDKVAGLPSGLGYEGAGQIRAVGTDVGDWHVGDSVSVMPLFLQSRYHMYGEQAVVPASALVARPHSVSAVDGAAVWMPFLTAYGALIDIARIRSGDHVVITAASSSVGLAAIQVVLRAGAVPIAVTNDHDKEQRLRDAGATHVVVSVDGNLTEAVLDVTGGRGADVGFDAVAGPGVEAIAAAMAPNGVLFVHGSLSGQPTPLPGLTAKRPVFSRPYVVFEITNDPERLARAQHYVISGLRSGALRPVIDRTFALDDIVEAHRYLESGTQMGKIVVTIDRPAT